MCQEEREDLAKLPVINHHKTRRLYSDSEKLYFSKEISRFFEKGAVKEVSDLDNGFVSSTFFGRKERKSIFANSISEEL